MMCHKRWLTREIDQGDAVQNSRTTDTDADLRHQRPQSRQVKARSCGDQWVNLSSQSRERLCLFVLPPTRMLDGGGQLLLATFSQHIDLSGIFVREVLSQEAGCRSLGLELRKVIEQRPEHPQCILVSELRGDAIVFCPVLIFLKCEEIIITNHLLDLALDLFWAEVTYNSGKVVGLLGKGTGVLCRYACTRLTAAELHTWSIRMHATYFKC